jgi:hypothetical protein
MILDRTIEFYSRTQKAAAPGDAGIKKYTYQMFYSTRASVQPAQLSQSKLEQWGLTTLGTGSKRIFIPGEIVDGQAWLIKDLKTSLRYEIRGTNVWPLHSEFIAEPYQGGDPI